MQLESLGRQAVENYFLSLDLVMSIYICQK